MTDVCDDQLTIDVDDNAYFMLYCQRHEGHTGKHVYKAEEIYTKRKFKVVWDNPKEEKKEK